MRYRELFAERDFTALLVADVLSIVGSYLSRLAVSALVFARTDSVALTAVSFAVSYAPYLFSPWLSTYADRFAGRPILIACDLARAVLTLVVVLPGLPMPVLLTTLFVVSACRIPFGAARLALLAQILTPRAFPAGNALVSSARQGLQVAGFAVGGLVISIIGTRPAIAFDAATFAVSGLIAILFLSRRPASWIDKPGAGGEPVSRPGTILGSAREGLRAVTGDRRMRWLLALLGVGPAILVVSEGLAVPFAHQLGGGTTLAGVVMAAPPLGTVLGLLGYGRLPPAAQERLCIPLAGAGVAGVGIAGAVAWTTAWTVATLVLLTLAGVSLAYLNAIQSEIAASVPVALRGRVFGLANAVLQLCQGAAVVVAGLVAASLRVAPALVAVAAVGLVPVALAAIRLPASRPVVFQR
jgi:Major Facilitator Superfamily